MLPTGRTFKLIRILIIAGITLSGADLWARKFTSQYCEFELPTGWDCALEGTEWVCQSSNKDRKKEAIIILAAKIRGAQDTLPQYQAYLKKPKTFTLPGGRTQVSEAKYTKVSEVNEHRWVDSLHMASEVPGFYTRYMATTKEDLGVAVTFSVAKDHYDSYQSLFDSIISTLKVFRQKKISNKDWIKKNQGTAIDNETMIPDTGTISIGGDGPKRKSSGGGGTTDLILYGGLAAAAAFVLMKLRKKKGGAGSKKKVKKKKKGAKKKAKKKSSKSSSDE